ncbi:MAG: alpha/beta hydrolase fold domain-containing protein [Nitriliruptorales bacterium]|nr:alpha/beta hydrolase fold domain-containing protein [Nitriliruptorales bacterium]
MTISWRMRILEELRDRFSPGVDEMNLRQIQAARRSHLPRLPIPDAVRQRIEHSLFGAPRQAVEITTRSVPGHDGDLDARLYTPGGIDPGAPLVVFYHGGGHTTGSPRLYDWLCTVIAEDVGAQVLSPDYRKAPEHPAPAAYDDAVAVFTWVHDHRDAFTARGPLAVAGDSAGGNLSAVVAIAARDAGSQLAAQVLIYPAVDLTQSFPSIHELEDEPILPRRSLDAFRAHYLSGGVEPDDPRVSPWFVEDASGLAPALVQTAEHDPLRDEGEAYARKLEDAGVTVRLTRYVDVPHGFLSLPGVEPAAARQATAEITRFLRQQARPASVHEDATTPMGSSA